MLKRGIVYHELIFISLNIIFFSVMAFFVYNSSTGVLVYEQTYSKQISLFLDEAKPTMKLIFDFSDGIKIAENARKRELTQDEKNNLVKIINGEVIVSLGGKGGYGSKYFSNYDVNSYFHENSLVIIVDKNVKK